MAYSLVSRMSPETFGLVTGRGEQSFVHLLISKGHNAALSRVLEHLKSRLSPESLHNLLQTPNKAQKAVVDVGLQSRSMRGVAIVQMFGGKALTGYS